MSSGIYSAIFVGILLICLCHAARLNFTLENYVNDGEQNSNVNSSFYQQRPRQRAYARCLKALKQWFGFGRNEIVSGNPDDVRFFLYPNPLDKGYVEELKYGNIENLRHAQLHPGLELKIVIHGFTKNYVTHSVQMIKDAYLARTVSNNAIDLNIILVDWEPLGNPRSAGELLNYELAVTNVPVVGKRVGEFIQFLMENTVVKSLRDVHIIGFSLGAHVAGKAGNTLKDLNAGQVPSRVTGLDPAGPAFYEVLTFQHRPLHKTDGRFVDVIHTNMGAMGTLNALGHADFYPNGGGPIQYSCEEKFKERSSVWDSKLMNMNSCSHNKAPEFFAMSILNPNMIACKCNSYPNFKTGFCTCPETAIFGEYCDSKTRGKFYLDI